MLPRKQRLSCKNRVPPKTQSLWLFHSVTFAARIKLPQTFSAVRTFCLQMAMMLRRCCTIHYLPRNVLHLRRVVLVNCHIESRSCAARVSLLLLPDCEERKQIRMCICRTESSRDWARKRTHAKLIDIMLAALTHRTHLNVRGANFSHRPSCISFDLV